MALDRDGRPRLICVFLMWHSQLVVANDLIVGDLLPFRSSLEVLRHKSLITEDFRVRRHCDEVVGRHGLPELVEEGAVVDAEGRCDAFSETGPVL